MKNAAGVESMHWKLVVTFDEYDAPITGLLAWYDSYRCSPRKNIRTVNDVVCERA